MSSADLYFRCFAWSSFVQISHNFAAELVTQLLLGKEEVLRMEKELDKEQKAHQKAADELQRK